MVESVAVKDTAGHAPGRGVSEAGESRPAVSRRTVWVLAAASGVAVANLYYCQPLLADMAHSFGVSECRMGVVSALTQVGYALGLLFFVPLGDTLERRRLIVAMLLAVTGALVATALSPSVVWLAAASLAVGMTTIAPQLIVPLAAGMAGPSGRGRVVGTVMSGLLIGILLSRTVSGVVGVHLGWRTMYWIAAGLMIALAVVLRLLLPESQPAARLSYLGLLRSLGGLIREQPALRQACLFGATAFAAFSAFWTTLAFFLSGPPYRLGSDAVGMFGLAGVAGALAAPLAGRLADRRSPRLAIGAALAVMLLSFAVFEAFGHQLLGLAVGVILLDLGAQSNQISNQASIYSLPAEAHNRLNTVYMVSYFVGGAAGSALGAYGWSQWGWPGVCGVGASLVLIGLAGYFATMSRPK